MAATTTTTEGHGCGGGDGLVGWPVVNRRSGCEIRRRSVACQPVPSMGAVVCRRRRHQLFSYDACVSLSFVVAFFRLVVRSAADAHHRRTAVFRL
uniref:Uncharacterized protein n=1 Tax=Plectus sambesii TaxID=2011161 RepID=A0A914XH80_9BILA